MSSAAADDLPKPWAASIERGWNSTLRSRAAAWPRCWTANAAASRDSNPRPASGIYSSSVGESATGYGVLHLHDQGGNVRVRVDSKDDLLLFNPAAVPVGRLSFGPKGGGYLQLAEPGGTPMVEAGAFADGIGRVIAGPNFKCAGNPAALGLGLPDCIKGHK